MSPKSESKYKTYKSDAAPFFFYIDVIPIDFSQYEIKHHIELLKNIQFNPIMPIPMRIDKVYNGESSTLIRPREPISFTVGEKNTALINPNKFVFYGIEKLLSFTEIRGSEEYAVSLSPNDAIRWWNNTRGIYGKLRTLEEDFAAFLRAYFHFYLAAKLNDEDLISAAIKYCELIRDVCNKRIQENYIFIEVKNKEKTVDLYKMKKGKVFETRFKREKRELLYPSFVDVELMEIEIQENSLKENYNINHGKKSKTLKYIPLLIYDDLLECMLQNLNILENYEGKLLDPSFLMDKKVVVISEQELSNQDLSEYSWLTNFDEIKINSILEAIEPTFP